VNLTQTKMITLSPGWVKYASIFLYTLLLKWVPLFFVAFTSKNILFAFFLILLFWPEIGIIFFKSFRLWLVEGIEDGDEKFNSTDLGNLLIHYSTLWCARLYVLFGLLEAFYGTQVREIFVMGSLAGAFGIEAIGFLTKRKKSA